MNCQQVTSLIVEAARGRMSDAAARDGAMRHAETCAACNARLAQEQSLTGALRAVASDMKDQNAPARVEAKLLAAFRESLAASQSAATNATPLDHATPAPVALAAKDEIALRTSSRRQPWRNAFVATAIAASLTLVALVTLYKQFTQTTPLPQTATRIAPEDSATPAPVAPMIAKQSPPTAPVALTVQTKDGRRQTNMRAATRRTSPGIERVATPRMITSRQVIDGGQAIFAPGEGESAANHAGSAAKPNDEETVTEFLPLVADAPSATPLEGGQLVRVQLPRAALASLGLPLNAERANEPVKADVLIGNDGLARAIRFVH